MRILYLLICLVLLGCSHSRKNESAEAAPSDSSLVRRDKKEIADCFLKNVEYFRKYHRYDVMVYVDNPDSVKSANKLYYEKYPGAERDPANFFEPYAARFSLEKDAIVASPISTYDQLNVNVDAIVYSRDSLLSVAFLIIESKHDDIPGFEISRKEDRKFDGRAIIGYRKNKNDPFSIYPVKKWSVTGFENYAETAETIKELYFKKLKGIGSTGSVYEGTKFRQNVGDKDFFEKSPYFQKHESGLYNFQMYRHLGKDYPYRYQTCQAQAEYRDTVKLSMDVDSVEVVADFFGCGPLKSFILYIYDSEIKKADYPNKKDITIINSMNLKNELIDYMNRFFIEKTEKPIESKTKRGWSEVTDYPIIEVTGFHENKEIFNNKIRIGDETYDIVYNPEFLKFYELLVRIAKDEALSGLNY